MAPKQQLDKGAWQWAETTEPENVNQEHIETAYRINLKSCKKSACRRNCRGNPKCLNGIGEKDWFLELDDSNWHDIEDPEAERRKEGDFVGLKNLGATCYVNTFTQVWFHNAEFRNAVLSWRNPEEQAYPFVKGITDGPAKECSSSAGNVNDTEPNPSTSSQVSSSTAVEPKPQVATCAPKNPAPPMCDNEELKPNTVCGHLQLIFARLQFTNRRYIDPKSLIDCLGLDIGQQQDAQEFSKLFMSVLETQLSDPSLPASVQSTNFIKDQFQGEYAYMTTCSGCSGSSLRPSSFYELDLNIKGHRELKECIGEFLQEEKLEDDNQYMCSTCNQKRNAIRRITLSRLPKVLNLQLLRFVFDRKTGHKKKLNTFIQFPELLDLSEYLEKPEGSLQYELKAVLIHRGPSAYSGHYIAHIKDPVSLVWHKFNDEEIEKMGGKNLQLGNEEDIEGKDAKRPRTSKGFHCSRNAYMLVYRLKEENTAPVPPFSMDMLPERVRLNVEIDKQKFNDWVKEMADMRDAVISNGRARQKEIQELYNMLETKDNEEAEWICAAWFSSWLGDNTAKSVPAIDNSSLYCPHGKMDPEKVTNAKCISSAAAEILYTKYSGGPRLKVQESLCRLCIVERCSDIRLKARVAEDSKVITASLKTHIEGDPESFWVGKASIRSWRRMALEKVKHHDTHNGPGNNKQEEGDGTNGDKQAGDVIVAMETEEESLTFNEDVTCEEHNNLVLEEGCRRLVSADVWRRLRKYFPDCPEFQYGSNVCEQCRMKKERLVTALESAKVAAAQQKSSLPDLYSNRNRPTWEQKTGQLNVVSREFLEAWRKFIKEPGRHEPVTDVSNSSLLCPHGGFMHNPETIGLTDLSQSLVYVWPAEWSQLQTLFRVDVEISVTRVVEDDGPVTFIVSPDICEECHLAREEAERLERTAFTDAVIFIRKLTSENKNMLPPGAIPEDQRKDIPAIIDDIKDDPEFSHTENGKRKRKESNSSEKAARIDMGMHSRRSSRHRKMRGEKEFTVSAHQKLWDLKIMVMSAYSSAPMDQHFYLDGSELKGDQQTLGSLGVLPSSILYLRIDEPCEDPMMMDDMTKASRPEEGFKGTGLLGAL